MPCRMDDMPDYDAPRRAALKIEADRAAQLHLNMLEASLCAILTRTSHGIAAVLDAVTDGDVTQGQYNLLEIWWEKHQEEDRKRKQREARAAARRKKEQERAEAREKVLAKLTDEERKLLGV